mmetsp:Transcript_18962/g.48325  ORF Transcript_18962/g.48325 Transcript_18962/m.48325 type:complete len:90 (+) Transcript_18962:264-533(+)
MRTVAPRAVVHVFWGEARWSRTQLLGELARGSWGMCRAEASDLFDSAHERVWKATHRSGRLIYAPRTAMSDAHDFGGGDGDDILSSDDD